MASTDVPATEPPRDEAIPRTYALRVTDDYVHVWEYRPTVTDPDGDWQFVEALDRDDDPRLSLEYAELRTGTTDGHWVYSRTYDCEFDCD
jgi:hypothetical protein